MVALPASYFTANIYLDFFPDRPESAVGIVLGARIPGVTLSWAVAGIHALKIAGSNPVTALRYE
tara:strand:- start:111 stop:302 length:192 start_codon:yes stop_codon:yes gene_type:complete